MLARSNSVAAPFDVVLVSDAGLACWELFGTAVGSGIVERAGDLAGTNKTDNPRSSARAVRQ